MEKFRQKYPTLFKIELCEKIFDFRGQKKIFFWGLGEKKKKIKRSVKEKKNYKKPQMKKRHFLDCAIAEVDDCFWSVT